MGIKLTDLFPNANTGLSQIGFFFGAGTSLCAGYPLMKNLTTEVTNNLLPDELSIIQNLAVSEGIPVDFAKALPDVEILLDLLNKNYTLTSSTDLKPIIEKIHTLITKIISETKLVTLEYHTTFFNNLKKICNSQHMDLWIFTTNYDLLFESAASLSLFRMKNAFQGINKRMFNISEYDYTLVNSSNIYLREPSANLVKLHGSIAWSKENNFIIEHFDSTKWNSNSSCLIYPQKSKVRDTLDTPYDQLFRYSYNILGKKCKYLVTCGYSYGDQHINQSLLLPKLRDKTLRIFALMREEPPELIEFKSHTNFHYLVEDKYMLNGEIVTGNNDLWDFINFVQFLTI